MRTIFVMLDSMNRQFLSLYDGWAKTPNLERLASRGVVFNKHYSGSLPCMPARREMMTGRVNFLEAPWGPIEPWDDCLPTELRRQRGVYSHIITDHYHYFHSGGEAYHTLFDSWEFERGQEGDVWRPLVDTPNLPGAMGNATTWKSYRKNRACMDPERDEDYSTPRCFMRGVEFLEKNHAADNWHLHLEAFDPHEPFDCPQRYRDIYEDEWDKGLYTWPKYGPLNPDTDDEETVAHIRKSYAGTLTMADAWLGKFLDKMDELDMWKDTALVLTTDHGHLLSEHGYWGKNSMQVYEPLAHIPLIVASPSDQGEAGRRVEALTASIDLMPTLLEMHGAEPPQQVHGRSLLHLLDRDEAHHDAVLFGYFGKDINLCDGRYSYCRQPLPGSTAFHHTAMPRGIVDFIPREKLASAETGVFLDHCHDIPHYRIAVKSTRHTQAPDYNPIYDLQADPDQTTTIQDEELELKLAEKMREMMRRLGTPESQFPRMGL